MKKHESWSDFAQFDGVIPLFDKNMNKENPNRPSVLRVKIQNHGFWSSIFVLMQLKIMRLISCFNTLSHGLKQSGKYFRYRVKLFRSRNILNLNVKRSGNSLNLGNNNNEVLNKDVNSILDDNVALSENTPQARAENTNLGNLKQFNTVNCSPIRMAKLQRVDSDLGVIIQWLEENRRPPRDKGAGYSPSVRNYWLNYDLLTVIDGVLFKTYIVRANEHHWLLLIVPGVLQREVFIACNDSNTSAHVGISKA